VILARTAWFFLAFAAKATWVWVREHLPRARAGIRAEWERAAQRAKAG
jgi:hypothetical protein